MLPPRSSALARSHHILLARSFQALRSGGWCFGARQVRILAARQMLCGRACTPRRPVVSPAHAVFSCLLSALRRFGADDEESPRTPSASMISLAPSLAPRQIVFFVWVDSNRAQMGYFCRAPRPPVLDWTDQPSQLTLSRGERIGARRSPDAFEVRFANGVPGAEIPRIVAPRFWTGQISRAS